VGRFEFPVAGSELAASGSRNVEAVIRSRIASSQTRVLDERSTPQAIPSERRMNAASARVGSFLSRLRYVECAIGN
jgi:hypothetical protein